jgi:LmbE family N-acetylglucosaminyl deacetylase
MRRLRLNRMPLDRILLNQVPLNRMLRRLKPLRPAAIRSYWAWAWFLAFCLAFSAMAQQAEQVSRLAPSPIDPSLIDPLPQDTGAAGLQQTLRRLQTTARLLQIDAHPDDEDGGMLTLESRGKGATVTLMTLNRGEGGQNKTGSNLFDELGVLRTLEVLAADRYYGVEQRFSRVADFGYSKSPEETFQKWHGHDIALADIVRVIRQFRPDVLVARFSGTPRDGHGHHQASSILTQEAFRAAADPNRFPEQIKQGLQPWQAKKLYIGNVCSFGAQSCADADYTLKLNTGEPDPLLGMSYVQFAIEGLKHQQSQGLGGISAPAGPRYSFYKLVDSLLPPGSETNKGGHEQNFFDGMDTSLPGLAARLGEEEKKVPGLRTELEEIQARIKGAAANSEKDSSSAAEPLLAAVGALRGLKNKVQSSPLSEGARIDLEARLEEKLQQAENALNLALNVTLDATVLAPQGSPAGVLHEPAALTLISPGQKFAVRVRLHNGSKYPLQAGAIHLEGLPPSPSDQENNAQENNAGMIQPGKDHEVLFLAQVPPAFPSTRPYWHRDHPEEDALNIVDDEKCATLPFPPAPFRVSADYAVAGSKPTGEISAAVLAPYLDDSGVERTRKLAVAPKFSVMLEPGELVIPVASGATTGVKVQVSCNLTGAPGGKLHLEAPLGWKVEPHDLAVDLKQRGASQDYQFKVFPASLKEGRAEIRAVLDADGQKYSDGYSVVTGDDLGTFYYYQPAVQRVSIVDVKVPKGLKIGYIMGAGDDIPAVLEQLGMNVTMIPAEKLATEDLSGFGTMVLGIRAYDTQKDVAANNKKLLDFVSNGGTLVVQYNAGTGDFNRGHFTPYPAQLSRARVSVEEAPVEILDSQDSVLRYPNQIAQRDFDGWVQERGLYFMDQWDDHFKPLLASNDPGEQPQKGGLLVAHYGKGTYIYTGYAFFRQLPAGVPGAIRLYVNLMSAGH